MKKVDAYLANVGQTMVMRKEARRRKMELMSRRCTNIILFISFVTETDPRWPDPLAGGTILKTP